MQEHHDLGASEVFTIDGAIDKLHFDVRNILDLITAEGQYWCHRHWQTAKARSKNRSYQEQLRYGPRINRKGESTPAIEWYEHTYQGGKHIRTYLPRGEGIAYKMSTFKYAAPWEYELIEETEAKFASLRRIAIVASQFRLGLARLNKHSNAVAAEPVS